MNKTKRPSPSKTNYYLVSDSGIIFIGKFGNLMGTLRGYDSIRSWSDWETLVRDGICVLNGVGEVQDTDQFISMIRYYPKDFRSKFFDSISVHRPQWVLDGEVILDPEGYTINYRDFI